MPNSDQQRQELAAFLRSRRNRRNPADVGLGAGRRRTPGLRREEVATLAGVSVTWYTWLEQARRIRVSGQVLLSLARALDLDDRETEHLFALAGLVPPSGDPGQSATVAHQYRLLLEQLDPNPAFVTNRRFDVLAWNRGGVLLYGDFDRRPVRDRNMLWLLFTDPDVRRMSIDWEADASYAVALFRSQAADLLATPEFVELVDRLSEASHDFRTLWERHDLVTFAPTGHVCNHPELGIIELEYLKMYAADEDRTLVAYLAPRGSELAARLADLISEAKSPTWLDVGGTRPGVTLSGQGPGPAA